jgi:MoxR-like ATPase
MPQIRINAGFQQGSVFPLKEKKMVVGRAPDCDIPVDINCPASRYHAEIYRTNGSWRIKDLDSLNGTLVNKAKIEDVELRAGDHFLIGDSVFIYEDEPEVNGKGESSNGKPVELSQEQLAIRDTVERMSVKTKLIECEIAKAIIGQKEIVRELLTAIISNGHVLMIGLPGLAKTMMIRTVADVLDLGFRRIQFTPDLMPSDITGTDILETDEASGRKEYRFIKGPLFTNILLADEINRTPPKTQAALLEAMQEHRVTAAGETYPLDPPFFVLATQNPLEQEGTYPLPEAQLDRFMFSIYVDYPSEDEEELIAKVTTTKRVLDLQKVLSGPEILELQNVVRELPVSDHVVKYATRLVRATRPSDPRAPEFIKKWIHCGAGPRASQYLVLAAKARAVIDGRLLVNAEDVRASARPVLRHRIFTNFTADSEGVDSDKIVQKLLAAVSQPGEKDY